VSEIQFEGNVTVYSDVLSEVQGEVSIILYRDGCLRYRLREMLLCTVLCVCGTG